MTFLSWLKQLSHSKLCRHPIHKSQLRLSLEQLEQRCMPSTTGVRPITEVGNNTTNTGWGTAGSDLIRLTPAAYADGISSPSLAQDPSARLISNLVNNQADPTNPSQDVATVNQQSLSDFAYSFGQFMDHDMDLSLGNGVSSPIAVPAGDPIGGTSGTPLSFNRTVADPATGTSTANPAQDVNEITSYLDLSQVYGSDMATDNALRTFAGGLMKTSPGGLPPLDNSTYFTAAQLAAINASVGGMANNGPLSQSQLFVTGDSRGNETVELTALQTLFLDNHNQIAGILQKQNPTWSDEQLFQEARKLNIAEYQSMIYNQYLPALLGPNALPAFTGYNPNVNPTIANEFSTVAFRFGHSLLSPNVERQGNNGQEVASAVPLASDFFDPTILNGQGQPSTIDPITGLTTTSIGAILKGNADGDAQAEDPQVISSVRDLLFNEVIPGVGGGQDLIALDIERGRDHGIGSYNQVRVGLGLPTVTSFSQITSNVHVQQELQQAYGTVDNIDAFEGGLAEDPVAGSTVGPLFQTIMVKQFTALRDGDRFFYLNESFTPQEHQLFQQGNTLTKVIENNTEIKNLQSNVFLFQASISGHVGIAGAQRPGATPHGLSGITVQLEDSSGDILATTVTNNRGDYIFNQLSGPAANPENSSGVSGTGSYQVVLALPSSLQQISPNPSSVEITRGDTSVGGVNFLVSNVATQFQVIAPRSVQDGKTFTVIVKAEDAQGHLAVGYTGTIQFSLGTPDAGADLPANYTFTAADQGIHQFQITLANPGNQTLIVTDTTTASILGQAPVVVNAIGLATHFQLIPWGPAVVGQPSAVLVVALDANNNIVTNYSGTVSFTSNDRSATLPANTAFTAADQGEHLFWVTFGTAGNDVLTAMDTTNSSISGSSTEQATPRRMRPHG